MEFPIIAGLLAAMLHVLSGPDHLAAVTPLVFEKENKHYRIGLFWGIGHVLGMLLIGVLLYFIKDLLPVESFSAYSEKFVGFILIGIGLWAFYRIKYPSRRHTHPHKHKINEKEIYHIHPHKHEKESHSHTHNKMIEAGELSAMGVGTIHGFAGVSHFLLMLPVLGFSSKMQSVLYMIGFAIGTVIAMSLYATIIGKIKKKQYAPRKIYYDFRFWGGLFAIGVGIFWIISN